jgi:hypothetical protein
VPQASPTELSAARGARWSTATWSRRSTNYPTVPYRWWWDVVPAEGRLEHDHSVLDGITTAEAQSGDMAILQSAASARLTVARSRCRRPALRSEREVMRSPTAVRKVRRSVERRSTDKRPGQVPDHRRRDANSADRFPNG